LQVNLKTTTHVLMSTKCEINIEQLSHRMKRVLTISLATLLAVPLATVLSIAQSNYAGGNYHTYYTGQPGYFATIKLLHIWGNGVPVFSESPVTLIAVLLRYRIVADHQVLQKAAQVKKYYASYKRKTRAKGCRFCHTSQFIILKLKPFKSKINNLGMLCEFNIKYLNYYI